MRPLWNHFVDKLLNDELAVRRWARSLLMVLGGGAIQVASVGWDVASQWTAREWAGRLALACVLGAAGAITAGEKNAAPSSPSVEPKAG